VFVLQGHERSTVEELRAGDIGVAVKLRDTHTGNTLSAPSRKLKLPKVDYPRPNIHAALRLPNRGDEDRLAGGLSTLHEEDPTFLYRNDAETLEMVISGQGELHLEVIRSRLKRRFNVDIQLAELRVPYRETIRARARAATATRSRRAVPASSRKCGCVSSRPSATLACSSPKASSARTSTASLSHRWKRRQVGLRRGHHRRLPRHRREDRLLRWQDHPVDSKDVAFQIAGKAAFKEAFMAARPACWSRSTSSPSGCPKITWRRDGRHLVAPGPHDGVDNDGSLQIVKAQVPQKELYRYSTTLRSLTAAAVSTRRSSRTTRRCPRRSKPRSSKPPRPPQQRRSRTSGIRGCSSGRPSHPYCILNTGPRLRPASPFFSAPLYFLPVTFHFSPFTSLCAPESECQVLG
jgi:elongation factor G